MESRGQGAVSKAYLPLVASGYDPSCRLMRVYREALTGDWLVQLPILGEASNRIVAEYRLRQIDHNLSGWSFSSRCWHILGLRVIDLNGSMSPITLQNIEASAWEYAYTIGADADEQADYDFFGAIHQAQKSTSFAISLDGRDLGDVPMGRICYGERLVVVQTMDTYYPKDKATVIGASTLTHTFDYEMGLDVRHSHTYSEGYRLYASYSAMMPTNNDDSAGIDTIQVGTNALQSRDYDGSVKNIGTEGSNAVGWHSFVHSYRTVMELPAGGPDTDGAWTHSGEYKMWFNDLAPAITGLGKFYVNYVTGDFASRVTATASEHWTRYRVIKDQVTQESISGPYEAVGQAIAPYCNHLNYRR